MALRERFRRAALALLGLDSVNDTLDWQGIEDEVFFLRKRVKQQAEQITRLLEEKPPKLPKLTTSTARVLYEVGMAISVSEARRLLSTGRVRVDGVTIHSAQHQLPTNHRTSLQIGDGPIGYVTLPPPRTEEIALGLRDDETTLKRKDGKP